MIRLLPFILIPLIIHFFNIFTVGAGRLLQQTEADDIRGHSKVVFILGFVFVLHKGLFFFLTGFIQVLHDLHSIWKFFILYFRENRYKNLWKINLKVTFYNLLYIKTFLNYGLIFFYFTDILIKTLVKYHFMETFKIRLSTVILPYYKWRFF